MKAEKKEIAQQRKALKKQLHYGAQKEISKKLAAKGISAQVVRFYFNGYPVAMNNIPKIVKAAEAVIASHQKKVIRKLSPAKKAA